MIGRLLHEPASLAVITYSGDQSMEKCVALLKIAIAVIDCKLILTC